MGRITIDQSHQVMATLAINTAWDEIDFEQLGLQDSIIRNPEGAGRQFTDFLKNFKKGARKLSLKSLKMIDDNIAVKTDAFSKDSFFKENGPVNLYFGSNFSKWILKAVPDVISDFIGTLLETQLTKCMNDSEISAELGNPKSYTISEFAAIISELLLKQPDGKRGILLNNGYANIFHVRLEDGRVVAVLARWDSVYRVWDLDAHVLGAGRWRDGFCVFSRG